MPGCKLKCIRKRNQSDDGSEPGQSQIAVAPVPSASVLPEGIPGPSLQVTPGLEAGRGSETPPSNDLYRSMKRRLSAAWMRVINLWKKTREPYNWQLLKSVTMFTLGLKLFDDLHRHMTKESTDCV